MPPDSRSIEEEGIRLDDVLLVDEGTFNEGDMRALLAAGPWPARSPDRNIADLKAQLAACARGEDLLAAAAKDHSGAVLSAYMGHVMDNGEAVVRDLLDRLPDQGNPKANWKQNSGVLRQEVRKGQPIRDASVDSAGNLRDNTGFLRAERNLLENQGWKYDPSTQTWNPPGPN